MKTYLVGVDKVGAVAGEAVEGAAVGEARVGAFDKVGRVEAGEELEGLFEVVFGEAIASGQHIASAS